MQGTLQALAAKGIKIYQPSESLAFALTPSRAIFITPASTCEVMHNQLNAVPKYNKLRKRIEAGEYASLCDFITDMKLKPGVGVSYRQLYNFEIESLQNV